MYSNTGYIMMGIVVQRVTGKSLREFAEERFFGPLKMTSTHYQDDHRQTVHGRAYAYSPATNGTYPINVWNNDLVGQGGVMTTILDLAKWDENFYTGTVGGPGFLARQLQRGRLNSDSLLTYAFGLVVDRYRGQPTVEHTGATGGYRAVITRFPKQHTSVAVLCNVSNATPEILARRVADYVLRADLAAPMVATATPQATTRQASSSRTPISAADIAKFAGSYHSDELDATYTLSGAGSALVLKRPRTPSDTLAQRDATTLSGTVGTLRFSMGPDGRADGFVVIAGRVENVKFVRR